jgi:hypothetical protein
MEEKESELTYPAGPVAQLITDYFLVFIFVFLEPQPPLITDGWFRRPAGAMARGSEERRNGERGSKETYACCYDR